MGERILDRIIALEKSLQREIEAERLRVESWFRTESSLIQADRQRSGSEADSALEEALARCTEDVSRLEADLRLETRKRLQRMELASESLLAELVSRHLDRLIPEADHDHQDGQG